MGEKSRANEPLSREELKKQNKKETKIILICLFVIIPLAAVFFTVWFLVEPRVSPEITVGNGIVTVKGLYPQEIDLQGATVTLSDTSKVPVDKRIAGSNYPNAGVSKRQIQKCRRRCGSVFESDEHKNSAYCHRQRKKVLHKP